VVFGVLPLGFTSSVLAISAHGSPAYGIEFKGNFWEPAKRILAGESPYQPDRLTQVLHGQGPDFARTYIAQAAYPAPAHVVAVPFGLLPLGIALPLFLVLSALSLVVALRLLGVSDWRCYGLVFLGIPTVHALNLGGLTPILVLGVALLWRFRDSPWAAAAATAAMISAKLYLWPLLLWLVFTRRFRSAALACGLTLALVVGGWAVIGFAGFKEYPHLLGTLIRIHQGATYSVPTVGMTLGLSLHDARVMAIAVGIVLLALALAFAQRKNERGAFAFALTASLILTPIVWQQYFLVLLVPIALVSPRLAFPWALCLTFWLATAEGHSSRDLIVAWATTAAVVGLAAARSPNGVRETRLVNRLRSSESLGPASVVAAPQAEDREQERREEDLNSDDHERRRENRHSLLREAPKSLSAPRRDDQAAEPGPRCGQTPAEQEAVLEAEPGDASLEPGIAVPEVVDGIDPSAETEAE